MIQFLELLGILFILYIITQIILPMIFPKDLERNWIFKKSKPIDEKIDEMANKKSRFNKEVDEVKGKIRNLSQKVDKADKDLDEIKNS